jgi:hypothetical protein
VLAEKHFVSDGFRPTSSGGLGFGVEMDDGLDARYFKNFQKKDCVQEIPIK